MDNVGREPLRIDPEAGSVGEDEFERWREMIHPLSSPANAVDCFPLSLRPNLASSMSMNSFIYHKFAPTRAEESTLEDR